MATIPGGCAYDATGHRSRRYWLENGIDEYGQQERREEVHGPDGQAHDVSAAPPETAEHALRSLFQ